MLFSYKQTAHLCLFLSLCFLQLQPSIHHNSPAIITHPKSIIMESFETSALSRLPNELLLLIVSCLDDDLDRLRLASCCQQLYAVVLPQLYTTITIKRVCAYSLSILTQTILKHSSLAQTVRSLIITNEKASTFFPKCHVGRTIICDYSLLNPIIEKASYSKRQRKKWERDLLYPDYERSDSWLALMLPFLPNLEYFQLDLMNYPYHLFKMMDRIPHMRKLSSPNLPFGSLTEVSIMMQYVGRYLTDTSLFLKFPALRKFSGILISEGSPSYYSHYVSEDEDFDEAIEEEEIDEELAGLTPEAAANGEGVQDQRSPLLKEDSGETGGEGLEQSAEEDDNDMEYQPLESSHKNSLDQDNKSNNGTGFSTVTHMHLRRSRSATNFSHYIRACAKLESFILEYDAPLTGTYFDLKALYEDLYQHRGTLQELIIVKDDGERFGMGYPGPMPSLSEFSVLKRLRLRAESLWGRDEEMLPLADRLPSSLESIYITEVEDFNGLSFVDQLMDVISSAHTKFPCLQKITLEDRRHRYLHPFLSIEQDPPRRTPRIPPKLLPSSLIEMCQKAGIEFRLVRATDFPKFKKTGLMYDFGMHDCLNDMLLF